MIESLMMGHPGMTAPRDIVVDAFQRQLDRLTIIREQFMAGEIRTKIKKDSWYWS